MADKITKELYGEWLRTPNENGKLPTGRGAMTHHFAAFLSAKLGKPVSESDVLNSPVWIEARGSKPATTTTRRSSKRKPLAAARSSFSLSPGTEEMVRKYLDLPDAIRQEIASRIESEYEAGKAAREADEAWDALARVIGEEAAEAARKAASKVSKGKAA